MFRKIIPATTLLLMVVMPVVGMASSLKFNEDGGMLGQYIVDVNGFINAVLIPFLLGIGFLFFIWGMFMYFIKGGTDDESKKKGKSLIVYATAGFVLIFIFWGLLELVTDFIGLDKQTLEDDLIPKTPPTQVR